MHLAHLRARRKLYLTVHPGSIAAVVALTSHSGFGELLYPYDDKATIKRKLAGLRFSLDPRTGAVVADGYGYLGEEGEEGEEKVRFGSAREERGSGEVGAATTTAAVPADFPYEAEPLVIPSARIRSRSPSQSPYSRPRDLP